MTLTSLAPELYRKERRSENNTSPTTGNSNFKENRDLQDFQPAMTIPEADTLSEPDPVEKHDLVKAPSLGKREGHSRHGGNVYVRDDIIRDLRNNPKALPSSSTFAEAVHLYESYRSFSRLATHLFLWTSPVFPGHMRLHVNFQDGGRGIVSTAGNKQTPYLLVSIKSFRRPCCNLPIEITYLGDDDLGEDYRAQLEMLPGVITRDLSQMVN
ncbi:hypothetical protein ACJ73_07117 [Blastomyces percursus]|uniref:Uncharacterized protein n=1 Tax=Blastomyces percursus TaxID=1658174 RepID=A0A1J9PYZ7_9EURO|nr:hypothetical protein ACJ73_07117 [Blastomyces percursus]